MVGTFFCDIDGCILEHIEWPNGETICDYVNKINSKEWVAKDIEGVRDTLSHLNKEGWIIVLVSARPQSLYDFTAKQLLENGVVYNHLLLGLHTGPRIMVNDLKPNNVNPTAIALNLTRNGSWKEKVFGFVKEVVELWKK